MTNFKKYFNESQTSIASLVKINETISNNGGELYVVGGPVRDFLLGHEPKDIDFLVRKLTLSEIQKLLSTIGKTKEVGESFGIVKCVIEGNEYDFAIPRTKEEKTGDSHTDFNVSLDPFAPVEADLNRRDFSFNSMAVSLDIFIKCMVSPRENAIALLKQNIIDPNGGLEALEARKLKAVGNSISRFKEDPLRIMRAIQFSTRMGFEIEDGTKKAMRELSPLLKTVSGERIFEEIKKAWTKGKSDVELMIRLLSDIGADKVLFGEAFKPEFVNLNSLNSDERVLGYFVCFFINGGDYSILKVDNKYKKILEIAKKLKENDQYPFSYIGNTTNREIEILKMIFRVIDSSTYELCEKMLALPIRIKDVDINTETIIDIFNIKDKKEMSKIGELQKLILSAIWDMKLKNSRKEIVDFLKAMV